MLIHYCDGCGMRISDEEVEAGTAREVEAGRFICTKCHVTREPPAMTAATTVRAGHPKSTPHISSGHVAAALRSGARSAPRGVSESARGRGEAGARASFFSPVVLLSAAGIGLLLAGVLLTVSSKKTGTAESNTGKPAATAATAAAAISPEKRLDPVPAATAAASSAKLAPAKNEPAAAAPEAPARTGGGLLGALSDQSRAENTSDERQKYGQHLLDEADRKIKECPDDVWIYRARIERVFRDFSAVQAGKDAAKRLAEVKAPEGGSWPEGFVNREVWNNIGGNKVVDLTKHANFSKPPSSTQKLVMLSTSSDFGDQYGSRIRGYLTAPASGEYTFWIASDDDGELWLSTNESVEQKKRIANTGGYTDVQNWNKAPSQKSAPVTLQRGKRYYFEVLQKEERGGDHAAVGWQLPNKQMERPILGARLSPYTGN